ncbi:MAG TPA: 4-(cytidine 5'-diphospho)-2-C-methyl-D-erythritol kinase [Verrucomicrobiae bacterium]|jgi:4-diphosphocytidyl-2-C-methyl-D-erythritol kinase|nr:4-(cytidine 5'-diphospho)-2-C-methyl-D-erythritol kinase [Verrucomicrobiae bacterium]
MKSVRVLAYAKVNLCLDVLGRRADGYHELRTVFQAISLNDTLELELRPKTGIELQVLGDGSLSGVPHEENLVYRALRDLSAVLGLPQGVRAVLTKRIPVGRGLGGGSSDAAAALLGLLKLAKRSLETARLLEIAAKLGADVPFFLHGGRALGIGRGDEIYPLPDVKRRHLLVVSPHEIAVPTKDAYQWISEGLSRELTNGEGPTKLLQFCALCWSPQGGALSNDFEAAVFPRYPRLAAIKRELLQQGAAEASLAGSGSAVFGIFQHPAKARRAARSFPKDQVFLCSTLAREEYRRKTGGPDLV